MITFGRRLFTTLYFLVILCDRWIPDPTPTPTPRASRWSLRLQFSFSACVNREVVNSLFGLESEDRANKPNKTFRKCCSSSRMQNFALLPILSSLILFTIFTTESIGYAKMSVEDGIHVFRLCAKSKYIMCRRKSAKITSPLTLKFLHENCAEEMNNVRVKKQVAVRLKQWEDRKD